MDSGSLTVTDLAQAQGTRIAHLSESDGPGGAERVLASLATQLQRAGCYNVVILPAGGEGWLARQLEDTGVAVEYYRPVATFAPRCARWLEDTFHRHRIGVAHSHEFEMAVYGAWAARRAGVGHVITMHGSRYYARRLRRRLALRAAIALSGHTVAVSDTLARQLRRDLWVRQSRVTTIPNGVQFVPAERTTLRDELQLARDDQLLLAVGNLYPVKGHKHLIDALSLLHVRHPRVHVAIAGRGDLADTLQASARQLGLSHRFHLLGLRSDIPALLAAADVFVLPSLSEGLPLALLEAMFAGRPIVASDVGQVAEALAHGAAGVLVEPASAAALAAALDRVLSDPLEASRLGDWAARRARMEYNLQLMVERYALLYREVAKQWASTSA